MKIGAKITLSLATILGFMIIVGGYSLWSFYHTQGDIREMQNANARAIIAAKAENEYTGAVLEIRRYIADGDEKYSKNFEDKLTNVQQLEKQLNDLSAASQKVTVEKLIADTNQYKSGVVGRLIPVLREQYKAKNAGNLEQANQQGQQSAAITRELTPFAQSIQQSLHQAVEENSKLALVSETSANNRANSSGYVSMILLTVAVIAAGTLSVFLTKQVTSPLQLITASLGDMAAGDFSGKDQAVLAARKDEFGRLAEALQKMKLNLKQLISHVQQKSEQLSAASEELSASAEQSAQAAGQVASSITDVASGADQQIRSVDHTLSTVEKTAEEVRHVAHNAQNADQTSQKTAAAATDGEKIIESTRRQMASIEETVGSSAKVVGKLGERSKQIGQIVDTISGIAGQTNLLALNAAIEAARAGEQGKGFAVVAEEVRKLAEQSEEAAKQIALLIREIQAETDQAVASMNSGAEEVRTGAQIVTDAGKAFGSISGLVAEVSSQVREIANAAQQLNSGSQNIVSAVQKIDEVSRSTAAQTQSVSAATEEQSASMQEIAATSRSLAQMAEELQSSVSSFRI